jgi:hypothetical protein
MPRQVFEQIRNRLWAQADQDDWTTLNDPEKSKFYEQWARDESVGGVLSRYMDDGKVRVYIKDTVMKPYGRERSKDPAPILRKLGIPPDEFPTEQFIKPHGRLFHDGRIVCWGPARNWKDVIMAVYERAKRQCKRPYAAVLTQASGVTNQLEEREIVSDYAKRLGVERLEWLDDEGI